MKPLQIQFFVGLVAFILISVDHVSAAVADPVEIVVNSSSDATKDPGYTTGGLTAILNAAWGKTGKKVQAPLHLQVNATPIIFPKRDEDLYPSAKTVPTKTSVEPKLQEVPVIPKVGSTSKSTGVQVDASLQYPEFFVITTIFNPASYQKRYELYHAFAEHMRESGAQLITIEAIFPSLNQTEFQVTNKTNPNHIQLTSDSVYWVKENLIDEAVDRLPKGAKYVAWIDADVHFHEKDWVERTISALQTYSVVQLFQYAHFLNADLEILRTDYSFGYSAVRQKPLELVNENEWYPHPGYGWAMTRSTFLAIGGLPDYDIVGVGDLYFAYTLINRIDITIDQEASPALRQVILEDSHMTYEKLRNISETEKKSIVGFVPVTLSHSWHGSRNDRGYVDRLKILSFHNFDFETDVVKGSNGLLDFVGPNKEELQEDIMCYFQARNEDSTTGISNRAPCRFMPPGKGVTPAHVDDTRCSVPSHSNGQNHYYGQKTYYTYNVYYNAPAAGW